MDYIEDSHIILPKGMGMPYVAIFDGSNAPIIDPMSKLNIGALMEHFRYSYDEEDDDDGELYIRSNNPELAAHPKLKTNMPIYMQWGWVFSNKSTVIGPLRKAIIIGKEATFGSEGLELTIKFSSASILTKNTPSNYNGQSEGFELYVDSLMQGIPVGVEIIDYSDPDSPTETIVVAEKVIDNNELNAKNPNRGISGVQEGDSGLYGSGEYNKDALPIYYTFPQNPTYNLPDVVGIKLLEYTPERAELAQKFPDKYKLLAYRPERSRNIILTGTRKNRMQQIKDLVNNMPKGPWYVDGRDNKLVIHNKKVNRPYSKAYTYDGGNGELIIFSINAEFVKEGVDASKNVEIDGDTGEITISSVQVAHNEDSPADAYIAWNQNKKPLGEDITEKYSRPVVSRQQYLNSSEGQSQLLGYPQITHGENGQLTVVENKPNIPDFDGDIEKLQSAYNMHGAFQVPPGEPLYKANKAFESKNEALSDILNSFPLTGEEYNAYINILKKKMDALLMDDPSEEGLEDAFKGVNKLPDYIIKRRVWIKYSDASGFYEGWANNQGNSPDPNGVGGEWGFNYLKKLQENGTARNIQFMGPDNNGFNKRVTSYERLVTLEVPVSGIRVLSGFNPNNADVSIGNDLKTSVEQKEKARATVVGDPSLESSQNILIKNVSSMFSGGWYTKKVTHNMSVDKGYLCDIEFVPRIQPYATITTKGSVNLRSILQKIYKKANAYVNSGVADNRVNWENKIEEVVGKDLNKSYLIQIDEDKPNTGYIFDSKKSFNYNQVEDPKTGKPSSTKQVTTLTKDGKLKS